MIKQIAKIKVAVIFERRPDLAGVCFPDQPGRAIIPAGVIRLFQGAPLRRKKPLLKKPGLAFFDWFCRQLLLD